MKKRFIKSFSRNNIFNSCIEKICISILSNELLPKRTVLIKTCLQRCRRLLSMFFYGAQESMSFSNKLDHNITNSSSSNIFRKSILKFIRPSANSLFNCHNPKGINFITRLRLGLNHLREHKVKHSFQDSLNQFCSCGLDIESTAHFPLHCLTYFILCLWTTALLVPETFKFKNFET